MHAPGQEIGSLSAVVKGPSDERHADARKVAVGDKAAQLLERSRAVDAQLDEEQRSATRHQQTRTRHAARAALVRTCAT